MAERIGAGQLVILVAPAGDLSPGVEQVPEPTDVQALVSQAPIEALYVRILGWLSRLDVYDIDLPFDTPCKEMPTGYLRTVAPHEGTQPW
jgi:hypothetical protein